MNFNLIVFDIDGTLTSFDEPVNNDISMAIRHLEDIGIRISLSSGKNLSYLKTLAGDLGIKRPIIIAENGCVIADVADNKEVWLSERFQEMYEIIYQVRNKYSDSLWEQPNRVEFTFFSKNPSLRSEVISYTKDVVSQYADKVHAYMGFGSIDVLPLKIDKGVGLAEVKRMYNLKKEDVVAVGNGENDIPMFKEVGLPLIVGNHVSYSHAMRFNTIREVLDFLVRVRLFRN
jgi:HAD superfamily hydrolase (TIGR01484 family)